MISIGRGIRWYNKYEDEVDFYVRNHFAFMQVWFKGGHILLDDIPEPKVNYIQSVGFPVILHAVFDPEDFALYGDRLLDITEKPDQTEIIVHPVCEKTAVDRDTEYRLAQQARLFSVKARARGIVWYLENNSILDKYHYHKEELAVVYQTDPYVEQLLDVAHIDNYQHLTDIIGVRFPKCLHVAGKHFNIPHEHLPLTQGDIDYKLVFQRYLNEYDGRIILEVDGTDDELIQSKRIIDEAITAIKE